MIVCVPGVLPSAEFTQVHVGSPAEAACRSAKAAAIGSNDTIRPAYPNSRQLLGVAAPCRADVEHHVHTVLGQQPLPAPPGVPLQSQAAARETSHDDLAQSRHGPYPSPSVGDTAR